MSKERNELWIEFYNECFYSEYSAFCKRIADKVRSDVQSYFFQMIQMMKDFIMHINNFQHIIACPIGCIELSFLRLSVRKDTLLLAFEAFDEKRDIGKCVANYILELDWFSEEWKEFRDKLLKQRNSVPWVTCVREEDIYIMLQDALTYTFAELVLLFKYTFESCHKWDEFQKLNRTKDFFYISLGEYRDEQKLLYVEREEFDIFLQPDSASSRYGRFQDKIFREKRITRKDFKGSRFSDCRFEKMIIEECKFNDNQFLNCIFYRCDFRDVKCNGAIFTNCAFDECDLEGIEWYRDDAALEEKNDDLYRKTILRNCHIIRCRVFRNKLEECQLLETNIQEGERSKNEILSTSDE